MSNFIHNEIECLWHYCCIVLAQKLTLRKGKYYMWHQETFIVLSSKLQRIRIWWIRFQKERTHDFETFLLWKYYSLNILSASSDLSHHWSVHCKWCLHLVWSWLKMWVHWGKVRRMQQLRKKCVIAWRRKSLDNTHPPNKKAWHNNYCCMRFSGNPASAITGTIWTIGIPWDLPPITLKNKRLEIFKVTASDAIVIALLWKLLLCLLCFMRLKWQAHCLWLQRSK